MLFSFRRFFLAQFVFCFLVAAGCGRTDTSQNASRVEPAATAPLAEGETPSEEHQKRMISAKEALFTSLSSRLQAAVASGGPAEAIAVCQRAAPEIAKEVSEEHELRIGRTGVRLRNQNNVAPVWAKEMTEAGTSEPFFGILTDGTAVGLLPIRLQQQCLICHGPEEQIAPAVQYRLAALYPDDAATGFQAGDLRGWFWVEVDP